MDNFVIGLLSALTVQDDNNLTWCQILRVFAWTDALDKEHWRRRGRQSLLRDRCRISLHARHRRKHIPHSLQLYNRHFSRFLLAAGRRCQRSRNLSQLCSLHETGTVPEKYMNQRERVGKGGGGVPLFWLKGCPRPPCNSDLRPTMVQPRTSEAGLDDKLEDPVESFH
jgi:hypothetical protein